MVDEKKLEQLQNRRILELSDKEITKIVNNLMEKPDREMWSSLKRDWLNVYDPNKGDLYKLVKEFCRKNITGIVLILGPISKAFGVLESAYFEKNFENVSQEYIKKNPNTRTSAQFILNYLVSLDFEKNSLIFLSRAGEEANNILAGMETWEDIYKKKSKALVVKEVYDQVVSELGEDDFYRNLEKAIQKYREEEMKVLDHLIKIGGSARNRGLYTLGIFQWEDGFHTKAIETWRLVDSSHPFPLYQKIRKIIDNNTNIRYIKSTINEAIEYDNKHDGRYKRLLKYKRWDKRSEFIKQQRSRK